MPPPGNPRQNFCDGRDMSDTISVSLSSTSLQVQPGGPAAVTRVTIQNDGAAVDALTIDVDGLDPDWFVLETTSASLFPGDTASGDLSITVPRQISASAGDYPFVVRVSSRKDSSEFTEMECSLNVAPFYTYEASIEPEKVTGAVANYAVTIDNGGNQDLSFNLSGSDPESLCTFGFEPSALTVAPGASAEINVRVVPGTRLLRKNKLYQLKIEVSPQQGDAPSKEFRTQLDATPKLPSWAIPAAVAGVALVAVLVVVGVIIAVTSGGVEPTQIVLGPGELTRLNFELPSSAPFAVSVTAEWKGASVPLDISLLRPNGTVNGRDQVTGSQPTARFEILEGDITLGTTNWNLDITNTSVDGSADFTMLVQRATLR